MKTYWLMIRFQLHLGLAKMTLKDSHGKISIKRLFIMLLIALGALGMVAFATFVEYYFLEALKLIYKPDLLLAATTLIVMLVALIYGVFHIISILYYSRDTSFLSSLPVPERAIFAGKMATVLLGEYGMALLIMGPAVVLYGLHIKGDVLYYLKAVATIAFMPFIPITLATFLASLLTKFSSFWKRKDLIMVLAVLIVMPLAFYFQFSSSRIGHMGGSDASLIIQLMLNQQKLIETVSSVFPPAYWAVSGLTKSVLSLEWLLFIALSAGGVCFAVFALGRRYTRLAVLSEEANSDVRKRKSLKRERYGIRSPFSALFFREWKEIIKTPSYALNCLTTAVIFPIMMVVMMFTLPNEIRSMDLGAQMTQVVDSVLAEIPLGLMVMVMAAMFGFMAIINPAIATAVSREGKCHTIYRMIPVPPRQIVLSKFWMGFSLSVFDSVLTFAMVVLFFPNLFVIAALGYLVALVLAFMGCSISLTIDMIKPKLDWRTETEVIKRSANVLISMVTSILLMVGFGFLMNELNKLLHSVDLAAMITIATLLVLTGVCGIMMLKTCDKYYANLE